MDERKPIPGRLNSIKLSRDLGLAIPKVKRQYTPNLNVVRNKDRPQLPPQAQGNREDKRKEPKAARPPRNNRNEDFKSRFVQSTGVFSEGGSAELRRTSHTTSPRSSGMRSGSKSHTRIWSNLRTTSNNAFLQELMNSDESDDETTSFRPLELIVPKSKPASLPTSESADSKQTPTQPVAVDGLASVINTLPEMFQENVATDDKPGFGLVRLPASFAGKGLTDDPNCTKLMDYPLSGMLEGNIGKVVVRRSGKMEIHIGKFVYDIVPETSFDVKQELLSCPQSDGSEQPSLCTLGNIVNNFILVPNFSKLV